MADYSQSLAYRLQAAEQLAEQEAALGGMAYLKHVVIDSKPEPRPFRLVAQPWQWDRARRIVPAFDWAGGWNPNYQGPRSFAETYPRGHDKTSFLARLCNHLLAFGKKRVNIVVGAGDEDQAALLTEAQKVEAGLNPWLWKRLRFFKSFVRGLPHNSQLKIQAADAKSSFGLRGDIYVLDEITHWKKSDFWESLLSGRAKMPGALFLIISNAGYLNTWQWDLFQKLKADPTWSIFEAPGQLNSWMDPAQIARDRKLIPPGEARRLFDNQWVDPAEASGYLSRPEAAACEQLGRQLGLTPQTRGQRGQEYVLSVDYGPKRDRTVLTVGHQDTADSLIKVDRMDCWQGRPEQPVLVSMVQAWVEEQRKAFHPARLVIDPYQMESVAQHFENHMPVERFEGRGGKSNYELAACLRSVIVSQQLAWYPGCGDIPLDGRLDTLVDELCGLVLKMMQYGYRIDHELTKHDDRAVSLGMLCVTLLNRPRPANWIQPPVLANPAVTPQALINPRWESGPRILYGVDWSRAGSRRQFRG